MNFKNQEVFRNQRSFNQAIHELVKGGLLKAEKDIDKNGFFVKFSLTPQGELMCEILGEYNNAFKD